MNESANEIINRLIRHIEKETCMHEETHRAGIIWEICDSCGSKWADDEGGKPEFEWPDCLLDAYKFIDEQKDIKTIRERESKPMNESALRVIAELYPKYGMDFWRKVQVKVGETWLDCNGAFDMTHNHEYRVIHHVHRVNGIECPAPMSESPRKGTRYFYYLTSRSEWKRSAIWDGHPTDLFRLELGICFHTKEDMIANFYAHYPHMRPEAE